MDETTMVLLTGLLGTILGAVIIGGALVGAYLLGRSRGRQQALDELPEPARTFTTELEDLARSQAALREEVRVLSERARLAAPREVAPDERRG
ncbi:MAG: hypothetical protein OEW77_12150 [Gemmatimonadota bacterium]|nr:hypothetical protein [Gemmatimonadota bacterium]